MRVEDRDVEKVKINQWLNNELWFRGIRKPASKIKVKAKKLESGDVIVELVDIPEKIKWKIEKENKLSEEGKKKSEVKKSEKKEEEKEKPEDKKEAEEKEEAIIEEGIKGAKAQHKEVSHESQHGKFKKQTTPQRMALEK
jgi:type III secretory pathway component EscV